MTMWKVWKTGSEVFYYIEKANADEAIAEVRKMNPEVNSIQACTSAEAEEIRNGGKQK